jgi:putative endonuclease
MFSVYILESQKDHRTYVGYSHDPFARLFEHNKGTVNATKNRRPLRIIFIENCTEEAEAKERESYWKSGAGRRKLKKYFLDGFPPITIGEARPQ